MSFNGSGTFVINSTGNPVVTGTTISSTWANALTADLATGLSTTICKDGQTTVTANIPMAGFKFTGLGAGSASTDSVRLGQVQGGASTLLGTVAGTNTITAVLSPTLTAYASGQLFKLVPANTNTGATTINIDSVGAKSIFSGGAACTGGELIAGLAYLIEYDGTQFNIIGPPGIRLATPQASTSGTALDFTGIPARTKRITIMFKGVSLSGSSDILVQIGDSGGIETSGYLGSGTALPNAGAITVSNYTTGFGILLSGASAVVHGSVTLDLENASAFTWVAAGTLGRSDGGASHLTGGSKSTSAELDRVRITTLNGTDTFDAGEINISYE